MSLRTAILVTGLVLAACGDDSPPARAKAALIRRGAPSVVLISIDSLRADHCSAWGYRPEFAPDTPTTPFLDRLCAEGVRFADAQAATSWTLASHVSILTGMNCLEHGVRTREFRLDEATETLAERFQAQGWRTAGFYSAPFLHPAWGFGQGFDTYEPAAPYLGGIETVEALTGGTKEALGTLHKHSREDRQCSERVVDEAIAWLAQERRFAEPFFLFLHLWDPHYDYEPPEAYADVFLAPGMEPKTFRGFQQEEWPATELPRCLALYDAEIRYTDDQVARLWTQLEEWGVAEKLVFAVTSDHGDEFFEHGQKGHHKTLYEEVTHVPLAVRAPGLVPAGFVVDIPVANYDVAPTLLDLAGVEPWTDRSGRSLRPLCEPESALSAAGHELILDLQLVDAYELHGWRSGKDKVIWRPDDDRVEVFDLATDPRERTPTVGRSKAGERRIELALRALEPWVGSAGHVLPMKESAGMRSTLQNLGYVDGEGK